MALEKLLAQDLCCPRKQQSHGEQLDQDNEQNHSFHCPRPVHRHAQGPAFDIRVQYVNEMKDEFNDTIIHHTLLSLTPDGDVIAGMKKYSVVRLDFDTSVEEDQMFNEVHQATEGKL